MPERAQHDKAYRPVMALLKAIREEAQLTQRQIGERLRKPQSWVYNCETGNRRVDIAEFAAWCRACDVQPAEAFARFLKS